MENTGMDRDLGNGSIQRFNPRTGKPRVVSGADAARTALTRERDAEESRKAGAPPIATGARGSQAPTFDATAAERQRLVSLASMRPDRNITPETVARATPEQVRGELSAIGTGGQPAGRQQSTAAASTTAGTAPIFDASRYQTNDRAQNVARAKADGQFDSMRASFNANSTGAQMDESGEIASLRPAGRPALAPSDPNNPDSPLVPTTPRGTAPSFAPEVPAMRNVEMAAGPNISMNDPANPSPFPAGSIGAQRANGSYTVTLADGTVKPFANEAAARAAFTAPAFAAPAPAAPMAPPPAPAPAPAAGIESGMAPAFTAKGIGQRVVAGVGQLATDQTAANPANFIDTAERYGTAALGAVWNGSWDVPDKGLVRKTVEAVQERNPIVRAVGNAIGNSQAQARQREAIAAGRIAPDFNELASRAAARYRLQVNGAPSFAQMEAEAVPVTPVAPILYGDPRNPVRDVTPAVQQVMAAASAPPVPVATPTNAPKFAAPPLLRRKGAQPTTPPRALEFIRPREPAAFPPLSRSATRPSANLMAFA